MTGDKNEKSNEQVAAQPLDETELDAAQGAAANQSYTAGNFAGMINGQSGGYLESFASPKLKDAVKP